MNSSSLHRGCPEPLSRLTPAGPPPTHLPSSSLLPGLSFWPHPCAFLARVCFVGYKSEHITTPPRNLSTFRSVNSSLLPVNSSLLPWPSHSGHRPPPPTPTPSTVPALSSSARLAPCSFSSSFCFLSSRGLCSFAAASAYATAAAWASLDVRPASSSPTFRCSQMRSSQLCCSPAAGPGKLLNPSNLRSHMVASRLQPGLGGRVIAPM